MIVSSDCRLSAAADTEFDAAGAGAGCGAVLGRSVVVALIAADAAAGASEKLIAKPPTLLSWPDALALPTVTPEYPWSADVCAAPD